MAYTFYTILGIKALGELLGMFFFAYGLAAANNDNFSENIVMGTVIMVSMQHSGSLFNPAVNFNFFLRGTMKTSECFFLMLVQLIGVFIAGVVSYYVLGWVIQPSFIAVGAKEYTELFLNETFFTFLLIFFINIQTTPETAFTEQSIFTGLVFMILLHTVRIESLNSGSVLNPALGISLPLVAGIFVPGYTGINLIWLWTLAPMCGGVLAWLMFEYLYYPHAKKLKMGQ